MGLDDLLISLFLKTHDCLASLSQAKLKGKDTLTQIHTLQIQAQSLQNAINSCNLSAAKLLLY